MKKVIHTSLLTATGLCLVTAINASASADQATWKSIYDFSKSADAKQWMTVNDTVMGGVSKSAFGITDDGILVFGGELSLDNNGGFTSIRTRPTDLNLDAYDTIAIRVKGDGRTYDFNLRNSSRQRASTYQTRFNTIDGVWQVIRMPIDEFYFTSFGRRVNAPDLQAKDIRSIGFLLADKKPGNFRLEVDWIRAENSQAAKPAVANVKRDQPVAAAKADIVETAIAAGSFKTLVAAVSEAELVETLQSPGPLTVFAPTDEAFAKLPKGTVESLLKPENRDQLVSILKLHVVPGRLAANDVLNTPATNSVLGETLLFGKSKQGATVDGVRIIQTDIAATNGIIHVIDEVLLPKTLADTAAKAGQFELLLAAAKAAGLADGLSDPNANLTVFAPTDAAFKALPAATVQQLLQPENRDKLQAILKYHILPGQLIFKTEPRKTLQGGDLNIQQASEIKVNNANVVLTDVKTSNGVIHVIDQVLLPELPEASPYRNAMDVIELAIDKGVPLFNNGSPEACAAIYEITVRSLLTGHPKALNDTDRKRLTKALADLQHDANARAKAWTLRYAMDDVYRSLDGRE